ncbi:DUF58 domain-containing protein [Spongisporangium articulatum]|uniref:DUF58 domain-containing protein n=1 Tax=Spongisporangium articulatum TaxID=3362603 RepID=A0ABW8AMS6_9ACTN
MLWRRSPSRAPTPDQGPAPGAGPAPDTAPALTPERVLRRLEWRVLRRLDGRLQGDHRTLFRGAGIDVVDMREYQPGDDLRRVDWNVTARTDVPHVREYLEDRDVTAWLVLDRSPSMGFGPVDRQKNLVVAELAGSLAQLLVRGGNQVGAVLFGHRDAGGAQEVIPPGHGRAQVLRILSRLLNPPHGTKGTTDLAAPLRALSGIARRRSLVVVVSDFTSTPGWERPLGVLSRRHDVLALQVLDPREHELPDIGMIYVEDPETGEQLFVDTADAGFGARLREVAAQHQADLVEKVRAAGTELHTVGTDEDLVRVLTRIAGLRRRGLR